jgi:predicted Zn-dependent protease
MHPSPIPVSPRAACAAAAAIIFVALAPLSSGCSPRETVPETGRSRPQLRYSEAEMAELGGSAYEDATKDYKTISGTPEAAQLERVGRRLAAVTGKSYAWEFRLLEAPKMLNAFCLPGGKVAVFSGILAVTQTDDGLAVVLGHEIAHATLQHGNERMSQPFLKRLIGLPLTLTVNIWGSLSPASRRAVMSAFGIGGLVGELLPYSQEHEHEADQVGFHYMKQAGFDFAEAPKFWQRMVQASPAREKADALSTHPDPEARIARLEQLVRNEQGR